MKPVDAAVKARATLRQAEDDLRAAYYVAPASFRHEIKAEVAIVQRGQERMAVVARRLTAEGWSRSLRALRSLRDAA